MAQQTAPHPSPLVPVGSPDSDSMNGQAANLPFQFEILTGTTDVIQGGGGTLNAAPGFPPVATTPICGTSILEGGSIDACTLAAPVAGDPCSGGNDGLEITIIDNSGKAHTVTTPTNAIVLNKHLITFNGTRGSFITLLARNGVWLPLASQGVTIT